MIVVANLSKLNYEWLYHSSDSPNLASSNYFYFPIWRGGFKVEDLLQIRKWNTKLRHILQPLTNLIIAEVLKCWRTAGKMYHSWRHKCRRINHYYDQNALFSLWITRLFTTCSINQRYIPNFCTEISSLSYSCYKLLITIFKNVFQLFWHLSIILSLSLFPILLGL